jgi:hypothetical protein
MMSLQRIYLSDSPDSGEHVMNWQDICDNPLFKDLPFKFETDRCGHIVMSPASNRHSRYQVQIVRLLERFITDGEAFPACSVQTTEGVKVADTVWASRDFLARNSDASPYLEAPEIVVEVLSPSNGLAEMEEKKELYFARGARILGVPERLRNAVLQQPRPVRTQRPRARLSDPCRVVRMTTRKSPSLDANFSASRFFCKPLCNLLNMEVF